MSSPVQQLPAATNYTTQVFGQQPTYGGSNMGWVGPLIMAGASIYGAIKGSKSQDKATEASLQSTREAIEFQKAQQEAERQRLAAMWTDWYNGRRKLMAMYGLDVPEAVNPFTVQGAGVRSYGRTTNLGDLANRGKPISDEWGNTTLPMDPRA